MAIKTRSSGPRNARIIIIGEAPGEHEEVAGVPFVGTSGQELTRMLHEAGIIRSECFLTNVCKYRPPGNKFESFFLDNKMTQPNELVKEGIAELQADIAEIRPRLILALGNEPLWALRGHRAITKWRGSMLEHNGSLLMPALHPTYIDRDWAQRPITVHDVRRAREGLEAGRWPNPGYNFTLRPTFEQARETLEWLIARASREELTIASDLETRAGFIACHGIAWSAQDAISIPYMCVERPEGYWTLDQEVALWGLEKKLLTNRNVKVVGQNYLYDAQYFARRRGYIPNLVHDTLIQQNVAFAGMPKGLDFLSSMYCRYHQYWKDEGKNWDPSIEEDQLWRYNCRDAVATWECNSELLHILHQLGLMEQYLFQMRVWNDCLEMMLRGVKVDQALRGKLSGEFLAEISKIQSELDYILGYQLNINSPKQVQNLFYEQFQFPIIRNRKTKRPTTDDEALQKMAEREPLVRCITQRIADLRSLGVVMTNSVLAQLDPDGRLRSLFSPTADTYRWTSSKNAWGGGCNMQNWTRGDEEDISHRLDEVTIPNVRKLIIPDEGYEIASIDLSGADAQTVAWESNDEDLKEAFRKRIKIHAHNARAMWPNRVQTGLEEPYYTRCKTGIHLTNYCGQVRTLAAALKMSEGEAIQFRETWFALHPKIRDWHDRIMLELQHSRTVYNKFGYRRRFLERVQDILPEAVAWIGQSTTACVTNRAFQHANRALKERPKYHCSFLLQVHDELVFQYPIPLREEVLAFIKPLVHITVPYDDPLIIPWSLKTSTKSWGDCVKREWPE